MKRIITSIIVLLFCSISLVYPQSSTARFLYWSPSAEVTGLGGTGVAISNNSFSAYYNPASFAFSNGTVISTSFMQPFSSFSNTAQYMLSVSFPFQDEGTIAISLNSFWIENQARTGENDPSPLGFTNDSPSLFSPTNYQIKASYATKLANNISFGASFSFLHISLSPLPTESEMGNGIVSTILLDAGFLITDLWMDGTYQQREEKTNSITNNNISPGVSIGFSLLNFGPEISFIDESQGDPTPAVVLLGLSYTPVFSDIIRSRLLIDFEKRIYDSNTLDFIHFGGEILLYKVFSLRGGYVYNNINSELSFPTIGVGINYKSIYANVSRYKKYVLPTWQFDVKLSLGN